MAKYNESYKDNIRKELMDFVASTLTTNESADNFQYPNKLLDVTGSLGCWGIVQLYKNGKMKDE